MKRTDIDMIKPQPQQRAPREGIIKFLLTNGTQRGKTSPHKKCKIQGCDSSISVADLILRRTATEYIYFWTWRIRLWQHQQMRAAVHTQHSQTGLIINPPTQRDNNASIASSQWHVTVMAWQFSHPPRALSWHTYFPQSPEHESASWSAAL